MPQKLINITGRKFGELLVLGLLRGNPKHYSWLCLCTCGKTSRVSSVNLRKGHTVSCGHRAFVHGHAKPASPTYRNWQAMLARTRNHRNPLYGARGVSVCDRWMRFENFLADMGERPGNSYSLDRYPDQNGNYEPGNVRWATPKEQSNNTSRNNLITFQNKTQTIAQWAEETGKPYHVLESRLRVMKWTVERTLTEEVHYKNGLLKCN